MAFLLYFWWKSTLQKQLPIEGTGKLIMNTLTRRRLGGLSIFFLIMLEIINSKQPGAYISVDMLEDPIKFIFIN